MRFLVIGLGSMGKRRIRLLKKINDNYEIFGIDNNKERREKAKVEYGIKVFDTVIDAVSSYKFDMYIPIISFKNYESVIRV